jgi:DNA-binding LacI/PurR family transcriptional regulator
MGIPDGLSRHRYRDGMAKQPTLEDVARRAGVSRSTVSRVVNRQGEVAPDVRRRVERAIARMGYQPHGAARALASGRVEAVDLVVIDDCAPNFGMNPYYPRVVAGVLAALAGTEARLRLHVVDEAAGAATLAEVAVGTGLGAVLVNVPAAMAEEFYRQSDRAVSLGRSAPGVPFVDAENAAGAEGAIRHLYRTGRHRIAAINGPQTHPCAVGRRHGYLSAMADVGLSPISLAGDFRREVGRNGARHLLATQPDIDAIFAGCDLMATGVLQALAELGRRVPDDVAVVGFDDCVLAACATPPLTSVNQPVEEIAAIATEALLHRQAKPRWERIMPTSLTIRQSSTG